MMDRDDIKVLQGRVTQGYLRHEQETIWFLEGCHVSALEQRIRGHTYSLEGFG